MALLLGIDLGTSYFKVGLFDENGAIKGLGRVPVDKLTPEPGRCELPVDAFWAALRRGLGEALTEAGATSKEIVALSYSSQASTFVLLDERDSPLTPLVIWTDTRGAPVLPEFSAFAGTDDFARRIGFNGLSPQSAVTKLRWFQRHASDVWARARRVMSISDYFTFALTGERVGDSSAVAFLAMYDLAQGAWWPEALRIFGVAQEQLSTPLQPGSPCGRTRPKATELLGVPASIPFAVGALDHHVAAIGSGLERLADLSISTGTVLAALALVDTMTPQSGCYHGRHCDGLRFWRLAFDANGAGQLEDYQRRAAPDHTIEELLALAARAPEGIAWRGAATDHGGAVRAILERVSATHRDLVKTVVGPASGVIRSVVATGGGARSPLWLQINANLLGVPVVTPACPERACLGAAAFAAVAAGMYPGIAEATAVMVQPQRVFEPEPGAVARYREMAGRGNH